MYRARTYASGFAICVLAVLAAGCILPGLTPEPTAVPTATIVPTPAATPTPAFTVPGIGACALDAQCMASGCSGQVCANESVITTCEWREEYACYAHASCGCVNGSCAWSERDGEFASCLADAGGLK